MANTLKLSVRTPESEIIDQEVNSLKIMTEGGEIEIYPNHASLTGKITFGKLDIRTDEKEYEYLVKSGILFVSVENNAVQILCFSCQEVQDIEYKTAKEYLDFIDERLKSGDSLNEYQMKYLEGEKIAMVKQVALVEGKE
jgi:ATP synthase F1 epsilon subunit